MQIALLSTPQHTPETPQDNAVLINGIPSFRLPFHYDARVLCDYCSTSMFNGYLMCSKCARECCIECFTTGFDESCSRSRFNGNITHDAGDFIRVYRVGWAELQRVWNDGISCFMQFQRRYLLNCQLRGKYMYPLKIQPPSYLQINRGKRLHLPQLNR